MATLTEELVDYALGTKYEDFSALSQRKARDAVIDFLGCVIGAENMPEAAIINALVNEEGGPPEATMVGSWKKNSALYSAMSNAYKCHILEFDDGVCGMHTGATILPAALAIAEKMGASGKEFLRAVILGIEAAGRICLAAGVSQNKYWHSTATCGVFGATMASGLLLGLDREQLVWALGSAGTMSAGLWEFNKDGTMSKYLHCAKAAYDGILASGLAAKGFTGAATILEGEKGFFASHSEETHPEKFFETLGKEMMIDNLSIKPFPSCSHTHAAITAALHLKQKYHIQADKVQKVIITTYAAATVTARHNISFVTPREARFSISGGVAAALLRGKVDKNTYTQEQIEDLQLLELVKKTEIRIDEIMTRNYPGQWAASVEVKTDCEDYRETVLEPWGNLRNPMPVEKLKTKYSQLTDGVLTKEQAETLWERCQSLETLSDVGVLFEGLKKDR